jgi:hypothetical protein
MCDGVVTPCKKCSRWSAGTHECVAPSAEAVAETKRCSTQP